MDVCIYISMYVYLWRRTRPQLCMHIFIHLLDQIYVCAPLQSYSTSHICMYASIHLLVTYVCIPLYTYYTSIHLLDKSHVEGEVSKPSVFIHRYIDLCIYVSVSVCIHRYTHIHRYTDLLDKSHVEGVVTDYLRRTKKIKIKNTRQVACREGSHGLSPPHEKKIK